MYFKILYVPPVFGKVVPEFDFSHFKGQCSNSFGLPFFIADPGGYFIS